MVNENGDGGIKMPLWLVKIVVGWGFIVGNGALGTAVYDHYNFGVLAEKYQTLKEEGTDVCKAHDKTDIVMDQRVLYMQTNITEMKASMQAIETQQTQNLLILREIKTTLEALKDK